MQSKPNATLSEFLPNQAERQTVKTKAICTHVRGQASRDHQIYALDQTIYPGIKQSTQTIFSLNQTVPDEVADTISL